MPEASFIFVNFYNDGVYYIFPFSQEDIQALWESSMKTQALWEPSMETHIHSGQLALLSLLDMSAVFDTVDHNNNY